jgi:hypothetical protein
MLDKYSKLEGKIGEEIRRREFLSEMMKSFFGEGVNVLEFLEWAIVSIKMDVGGKKTNVVEIRCKRGVVRFVLEKKLGEMKGFFEEGFLDNNGQNEKIVFRLR